MIVELFTSQGCSSCPPADRILRRLASGGDSDVIPLSFHVDYWNYIGWTDPFSSEAWAERQTRYARQVFGTSRIYTPQVVVNGQAECVGSNERLVMKLIEQARRRAADGRLDLTVLPGTDAARPDLRIEVQVRNGAPGQEWDVMVALYENELVTPVARGENTGRTLQNSGVVRRLEKAFSVPARAGERRSERYEIVLGEGWKRSNMGIAVFLQDPSSLAIHGAAAQRLDE